MIKHTINFTIQKHHHPSPSTWHQPSVSSGAIEGTCQMQRRDALLITFQSQSGGLGVGHGGMFQGLG